MPESHRHLHKGVVYERSAVGQGKRKVGNQRARRGRRVYVAAKIYRAAEGEAVTRAREVVRM